METKSVKESAKNLGIWNKEDGVHPCHVIHFISNTRQGLLQLDLVSKCIFQLPCRRWGRKVTEYELCKKNWNGCGSDTGYKKHVY